MLYRRFGRTELQMPVLSCGGMRYQHKWQDVEWREIPKDNQDNLEATLRRALELGINHIETARGYGSSEMQLGQILPQFPREELIVQTKVSPSTDVSEFLRKFETSMAYLNLDTVDLLSLHGINTDEILQQCLKPGGCVDMAYRLVDQGRVRFVGFSTHGPTDVIIRAVQSNRFAYVNLHWYYINQNNWPAIEAAHALDMGVFIISPSDKGGRLYSPPQRLMDLCHPLSPMVFNDLFCLSHPQVHTLSVGAARPTDFDEHLKAVALLDQSEILLPPILERLEKVMEDAVGEAFARTWRWGVPPQDRTPGNINIPVIVWLWTLVKAYDLVEYAKARYNMLGNASHWFPGRKLDRKLLGQLRIALRQSPHCEQILYCLQEAHRLLADREVKRLSQR